MTKIILKNLPLLSSIVVGAGAMYYLDPVSGRRRRARTQDKLFHFSSVTKQSLFATLRHGGHELLGLLAYGRSFFTAADAPDAVVIERVRSRIGRVTTHPRSIEAKVDKGVVTLTGRILPHDAKRVVSAMRRVPGVKGVRDLLEVHQSGQRVPGLQGEETKSTSQELH